MRLSGQLWQLALLLPCAACSAPATQSASSDASSDASSSGSLTVVDTPLRGATTEQRQAFAAGDYLFDLPERPVDGLGPLYTRDNCGDCHRNGARGPGFVQKMSVVEDDQITAASDQSALPFGHTVRSFLVSPAQTPVEPPPGNAHVRVSERMGPPILGRGYLEAIADSEIERVAAEQADSGGALRGRVNYVSYGSEPNPDSVFFNYKRGERVIGRFGLKARISTLDDFTADALQSDIGITSPLRPSELPNPDRLLDDQKPGVDATADGVNQRAMYLRLLAIPERAAGNEHGAELFSQAQCNGCHVPSLHTRADYPIAELADIDAPIYSDLLLHDMGDTLADGMVDGVDGDAHSRDFRSAPLIGLRFNRAFLHDGRAHSVSEAIALHEGPGSEANPSVAQFLALSAADQQALVAFVSAL